ncbi:hypothetical protein [Legionella sp. km772]|uniref:hypothetical protein n=1 Tax=Legionella sp. km772 TaxID=2498111 RepID=UPI000F8D7DD0|nr:hypothetical protein [Legionella sp. km772]RUR05949.1 hypothetical protein ELY15_13685 [Legionella sp. km772]
MKTTILTALLFAIGLLAGCTKTALNANPNYTYIYTEDDEYKSKRVDYLGYGLGGQGFGGYSMGGYGLTGYGGQMPL